MRSTPCSVALLVALSAGSVASAQCQWNIGDVPDFDQRRTGSNAVGGLPAGATHGQGSMFCVPTSAVNWFAYFANRGSPQPATLSGPRDWQSAAQYVRVSDTIRNMGVLMDTDADKGTGGGQLGGVRSYNLLFANSDFTASQFSTWGSNNSISPSLMAAMRAMGGYMNIAYGRYDDSSGVLTRSGGHVMTLSGMLGNCASGSAIAVFRDPADDAGNTTQSTFKNGLGVLTSVTGFFRRNGSSVPSNRTLWRLDTTDVSNRFVDSLLVIFPQFALTTSAADANEIQLIRPFVPAGSGTPLTQAFNKPAGTGDIIDIASGIDGVQQFYITDRGTLSGRVWRIDLSTGVSTLVVAEQSVGGTTSFNALRRIAVGRRGDLYTVESNIVRRYDVRSTPVLLDTYTAPTGVAAITYDDDNDRVVLLTTPTTSGPRTVISLTRDLASPSVWDLPVTINGEAWIVDDQSLPQTYWVMGGSTGFVRRVQYSSFLNGLQLIDSIGPFLGSPLTMANLAMLDGNRVVFELNGSLREYEESSSGGWAPRAGSRWAGQTLGARLAMSRSRTDFDPIDENDPAFDNIEFPPVYPALGGPDNTPGCYANCDGSTIAPALNAGDFTCFLARFRQDQGATLIAQLSSYANCDGSTISPVLNAGDFNCYLARFRSGCP